MRNKVIIIAIIGIVLLYISGTLPLDSKRLVNPGSLLMILGGVFVFFSNKIAPVIGLDGEKGNLSVKLVGLGLLILALIILFTANL